MFERPLAGDHSVLVSLDVGSVDPGRHAEFVDLAKAAGAKVDAIIGGHRRVPDPKYYVGSGKAEEIRQMVADCNASLVVFNHPLSPSQERNLERLIQRRVLDRTGLILDIFAQRARSFEGKLQVELAQLRHLSTRLVRGWSHLERQKGGIGLRGPGEKQLETDRRLLAKRVHHLEQRLERVANQREQGRALRRRAGIPTVALVGYTNAGKSTLFNALTGAGLYAADQLFATLDPTLRRISLAGGDAIVVDTVGFVSDLPHELVAAFRATLEETRQADLLLHVIDASTPERDERIAEVETVLAQIGAQELPALRVYNKIDLIGEQPRVQVHSPTLISVWVSAAGGVGLDLLRTSVAKCLAREWVRAQLLVPCHCGKTRARLFELGAVLDESMEGTNWVLDVSLSKKQYDALRLEPGVLCRRASTYDVATPMNGQ